MTTPCKSITTLLLLIELYYCSSLIVVWISAIPMIVTTVETTVSVDQAKPDIFDSIYLLDSLKQISRKTNKIEYEVITVQFTICRVSGVIDWYLLDSRPDLKYLTPNIHPCSARYL